MNISKILSRTLVATLIVSASASVFATSAYQGLPASQQVPTAPSTVSQSTQPGKTREQVIAEMVQAERDGLTPIRHNEYPLSAQAIASNRAHFAAAEQFWQHKSQDVTAQR